MEKRGQFTILVVFAIVIVAAVAISLSLSSSVEERVSRNSAQNALQEFVEANLVRDYVESCLQSVGEDAMLKALRQGGVIWKDQGGPVEADPSLEGDDYMMIGREKVAYAIESVSKASCPTLREDFSSPWEYPYAKPTNNPEYPVKISELNNRATYEEICSYYHDAGFAGTANVRKLCTVGGPNFKGNIARPSVYNTCGTDYGYEEDNPVQHQLRNYTEEKLGECTDFESLSQIGGFRIEVIDEPNASFSFGKEGVTITAEYPVKVSPRGVPPTTLSLKFTHRSDARFKQLYNLYRKIVRKDTREIGFEAASASGNGFEVEYQEIAGSPDNLLVVRDTATTLAGRTPTVQAVVRNRAPVLDKMGDNERTMKFSADKSPVTVRLEPRAVDPDDTDKATITYSYKNPSTGLPIPEWANSAVFRNTRRAAEATFQLDDGQTLTQIIVINASDPHGAYDYQEVEVKVTNAKACNDGENDHCTSPGRLKDCRDLKNQMPGLFPADAAIDAAAKAECTATCSFNIDPCIATGNSAPDEERYSESETPAGNEEKDEN